MNPRNRLKGTSRIKEVEADEPLSMAEYAALVQEEFVDPEVMTTKQRQRARNRFRYQGGKPKREPEVEE